MTFRTDVCALEELMESMIICDTYAWVWSASGLSLMRVSLPLLMTLLRRGFMTIDFLLEYLSLEMRGIPKKLHPAFAVFQALTDMSVWHI